MTSFVSVMYVSCSVSFFIFLPTVPRGGTMGLQMDISPSMVSIVSTPVIGALEFRCLLGGGGYGTVDCGSCTEYTLLFSTLSLITPFQLPSRFSSLNQSSSYFHLTICLSISSLPLGYRCRQKSGSEPTPDRGELFG